MRKLLFKSGIIIGLALLSSAALGALEEVQTNIISIGPMFAFILFLIIVIVGVYFARLPGKRRAPVSRIFEKDEPIHSVGPDTPVTECARTMTTEKIGAVLVMDGERLIGIFTERDALNRVLAAGLDPVGTKVSEVMTEDLIRILPTTTVDTAMELVTRRRARHLPIVENGKVLAVLSSGDLIHWLVKDQMREVQELVDLAARS